MSKGPKLPGRAMNKRPKVNIPMGIKRPKEVIKPKTGLDSNAYVLDGDNLIILE